MVPLQFRSTTFANEEKKTQNNNTKPCSKEWKNCAEE